MGEGLAAYGTAGAGIMRPYYLTLMAAALAQDGKIDEAAARLDEAEAAVGASGEGWFEPEIHRLRGELRLAEPALAEAAFQQALSIATRQGARAPAARAVESFQTIQGTAGQG